MSGIYRAAFCLLLVYLESAVSAQVAIHYENYSCICEGTPQNYSERDLLSLSLLSATAMCGGQSA